MSDKMDISRTALTGHQVLPTELTDRYLGEDAAKQALKASGYMPLADRKNGTWKLASYHIFNAVGGLVSYAGSLAANSSQVMGSQKWYFAGLKDLGQTYLNAKYGSNPVDVARNRDDEIKNHTGRAEKVLRALHNGWSAGWGTLWNTVPSLLGADLYGTARSAHSETLSDEFSKSFRQTYGRPPSAEITAGMTVGDLLEMAHSGNYERLAQATKTANDIRASRPNPQDRLKNDLTVNEIRNGPDHLKAAFAADMQKELALENMHFMNWAEMATKGIPGAPGNRDALVDADSQYGLSKYAIMQGYRKGVKTGSPNEINITDRLRRRWDAEFNRHMPEFIQRWDDLENELNAAKRLLNLGNLPEGTPQRQDQIQEIRRIEAQMKDMQNERLDTDVSRKFGGLISDSYSAINLLSTQSAQRFSSHLKDDTPENEARTVFNRVAAQTNDGFARELFTRVTGRPAPQVGKLLDGDTLKTIDDILKNNPQSQALTSQQTTAILDGDYHTADYSPQFRGLMEVDTNKDLSDLTYSPNRNQAVISNDMQADIGRATYVVNQEVLSSPDHETYGSPETQRANIVDGLSNAGIPERYQERLSTALNQQLFLGHQKMTLNHSDSAPMPLVFNEAPPLNEKFAAGAEVRFEVSATETDGVYNFVAFAKKPLQGVIDTSMRAQDARMDPTDQDQSYFTIQMQGQIDCTKDKSVVSLTGGRVGYAALPDLDND